MRNIRKIVGVLFIYIFVVLITPIIVNAETTYVVKVTSNPSNINDALAVVSVQKDVTTIAQVKQKLREEHNINTNDYLFLSSSYQEVSDNTIIGNGMFMFSGLIDGEQFTALYAMPIDNTERKITIKSIPPKDENVFASIVETNYELFEDLSMPTCNNTFTVCTFKSLTPTNFKAFNNVVINYSYDNNIKTLAQRVIDAGLLNKTSFKATDVELLHYLNYGGSLADYTGEFKNQISNINFKFEMDQRGGGFEPLSTNAIGFYKFIFNDTLYGVKDFMSITADHIIYVPTNTTNIKEAIEARLNEMFKDELHLSVATSTKTINEMLEEYGEQPIDGGDELYYIITITDENRYSYGEEFFFKAVKDSSKINNKISFKSSDLITNVSVSSDGKIPLDTMINVNKITIGEEYDKIIKALNISEGEMFDINLKSNAQNKLIRTLENGKFEVSIPIPEKYEGKELIIYYVDENNKVTEHEVTVKDGYATFETDHFSTYTLTINKNAIKNPKTGDNLIINIIGLLICGVIGIKIYSKKKMFN